MEPRRAEVLVLQRHGDGNQAVVAFTLDDVAYLASAAGVDALGRVDALPLTDASLIGDIATVRSAFGDRTAVLVETVRLRRRASAKLAVTGWLFTDEALQQATAAPVAAHRARRLAGRDVHDVTCSVGTELVALQGESSWVMGSDVDAVRLAMARHNIPGVTLARADALRPVSRDTVVVADPARRSGGRRRFDPAAYQPPLDALLDTYRDRDLVVKCAPGIDFDHFADRDCEIEVTSLDGDVREACLWSTGLAEPGVRRRATMLTAGGVTQVTDAEPDDCPVAPAGRWIVDPDGAVVRAGLVRHWAARHGLWQLDSRIAYLSGDELPSGTRGFEVLKELAYSERRLRQSLSGLDCGAVEILVRGVDVDPAQLRPRLRLRGTRSLSVVLTRVGARPVAYVCRSTR